MIMMFGRFVNGVRHLTNIEVSGLTLRPSKRTHYHAEFHSQSPYSATFTTNDTQWHARPKAAPIYDLTSLNEVIITQRTPLKLVFGHCE
jgi:hypothetical protein